MPELTTPRDLFLHKLGDSEDKAVEGDSFDVWDVIPDEPEPDVPEPEETDVPEPREAPEEVPDVPHEPAPEHGPSPPRYDQAALSKRGSFTNAGSPAETPI